MDLAQIQREGKLTSSCLVDVLVPFKGEPGFVKHTDLPLLGVSMGPPFMTVWFIISSWLLLLHIHLWPSTLVRRSHICLQFTKAFPLPYWLKAHHNSVRINVANSIIQMWMLRLTWVKRYVQSSSLAETEHELRCLTQIQQSVYLA